VFDVTKNQQKNMRSITYYKTLIVIVSAEEIKGAWMDENGSTLRFVCKFPKAATGNRQQPTADSRLMPPTTVRSTVRTHALRTDQ
jgi:hypothetical protein